MMDELDIKIRESLQMRENLSTTDQQGFSNAVMGNIMQRKLLLTKRRRLTKDIAIYASISLGMIGIIYFVITFVFGIDVVGFFTNISVDVPEFRTDKIKILVERVNLYDWHLWLMIAVEAMILLTIQQIISNYIRKKDKKSNFV